ncbi:MAG: hypothetical protein JW751_26040 [Polyangiaceae bacterium]|nr:hypothetical protein [Polyangiaceae bacterium]
MTRSVSTDFGNGRSLRGRAELALLLATAIGWVTAGCRGCRSGAEGKAEAPAQSASSTSPVLTIPSALPARRAPSVEPAREHRVEVLKAIDLGRRLAADGHPREALVVLAKAIPFDPTGGLLAVELARAALAARDQRRTRDWAERARRHAHHNPSVLAAATEILRATGAASPPSSEEDAPWEAETMGPYPSEDAGCSALVEQINLGKSPALGLGRAEMERVDCVAGTRRAVRDAGLKTAAELRVLIREGGRTEASWIALGTPRGVFVHGPVARVHSPAQQDLDNAYLVRLDPVDVLAGGARELAVGVEERTSYVDVAANELLDVDRTRLLVLTLDRGGVTSSPSITTFELAVARAVDPEAIAELPSGYAHSPCWQAPERRQFRLRWGDNEVELSATAGSAGTDSEQRVRLFE